MKIPVYPMDYEEFSDAIGSNSYEMIRQFYQLGRPIGQQGNRALMRAFRLYMAVGGMPQAVEAYREGKNFTEIDMIKRSIIDLYEADFKKIDSSGRISAMYHSIPAQLSKNKKRYVITDATKKRKKPKDHERLYDLIDSKTVLISYNTTDPRVSLTLTKDFDSYKIYLSDTGLFITLLFMDRPETQNTIYSRLLSDKLPANLGYLYENAAAQIITASGRELFYHTWKKKGSTHYYEVDFLLSNAAKLLALEVKSSGVGKHESLNQFRKNFSNVIQDTCILSQKDVNRQEGNLFLPVYMLPFLCS